MSFASRSALAAAASLAALAAASLPVRAEMMIGGFGPSAEAGHPLRLFSAHAQGAAPPVREIAGPDTLLHAPMFGIYEPGQQLIYVSDFNGQAVRVYAAFASGDAAPLRVLDPPQLGQTRANAPVPEHGELGVIGNNCCIYTYALDAGGSDAQRIRGVNWGGLAGGLTELNNPGSLIYLPDTDEYAVLDFEFGTWARKIVFHARTANGQVAPTRTITGAGIANAVGLAYDGNSRRLFVLIADLPVNGIQAGRIAVFDDDASGGALPLFTIEGAATELDRPVGHVYYGIGYDPYTDRLMVSTTDHTVDGHRVVVLPSTVAGNVAALQVLHGPNLSPHTIGIPFGVPATPPDTIFQDGFEGTD